MNGFKKYSISILILAFFAMAIMAFVLGGMYLWNGNIPFPGPNYPYRRIWFFLSVLLFLSAFEIYHRIDE